MIGLVKESVCAGIRATLQTHAKIAFWIAARIKRHALETDKYPPLSPEFLKVVLQAVEASHDQSNCNAFGNWDGSQKELNANGHTIKIVRRDGDETTTGLAGLVGATLAF